MSSLLTDIQALRQGTVGKQVRLRIRQFRSFPRKPSEEWFSELCFCLLTANARGRNAFRIQQELGTEGFCSGSEEEIRSCIIRNRHRFHNTKARYILLARAHRNIKQVIQPIIREQGSNAAREWLVGNIKGLGYKEASHFLRNVGTMDLAIVDRHILRLLVDHRLIRKPKNLNRVAYLQIEGVLSRLAAKLDLSIGELDLYLWSMKAGEVLK